MYSWRTRFSFFFLTTKVFSFRLCFTTLKVRKKRQFFENWYRNDDFWRSSSRTNNIYLAINCFFTGLELSSHAMFIKTQKHHRVTTMQILKNNYFYQNSMFHKFLTQNKESCGLFAAPSYFHGGLYIIAFVHQIQIDVGIIHSFVPQSRTQSTLYIFSCTPFHYMKCNLCKTFLLGGNRNANYIVESVVLNKNRFCEKQTLKMKVANCKLARKDFFCKVK